VTTRRQALASASARLREVLAQPENDVSRDAAIQRFEFCFELAWKAVQESARDDRNQTSHTYDEALAKAVYSRLSRYLPLFEELANKLAASACAAFHPSHQDSVATNLANAG